MPLHVLDIGPFGPLVAVGLSVGAAFARAGLGGPPRTFAALIDTGATMTAISPGVVQALQAERLNDLMVQRPGMPGSVTSSFDVRLRFEGHLAPHPWFDLEAVETAASAPGIDVLIGQDVLRRITLLANGPLGKLVLMY